MFCGQRAGPVDRGIARSGAARLRWSTASNLTPLEEVESFCLSALEKPSELT